MPTIKDWYQRVNAEWPSEIPVLTDWEAIRAAAKLYRSVRGIPCPLDIKVTSGNRYSYAHGGVLWVNPERGWHHLIHDLSHYLIRFVYSPEPKAHSPQHARFERKLVRLVVSRGWLSGKLKKEEPEAKPEPSKVEVLSARRERIEQRMQRWESKRRRAERALAKLQRERKRVERIEARAQA